MEISKKICHMDYIRSYIGSIASSGHMARERY